MRRRARRRRDQDRDRGSASLEFLGVLPILLLIALAGIQLGLAAYAASEAGTAARAAARAEAKYKAGVTGKAAGDAAVSSWLQVTISDPSAGAAPHSVQMTATIQIPAVIPLFNPGSVSRSATMPKEDTTTP
ncbi:TadE/TadG family type IV pilus assembly protein [Actinacidiphila oryziradicis]|uniref:Pilus assembly protein n=1 Tax=Actinacidiphila oryziradicis TaxID=2571141 RepID=A0A4U0S4K8_9ACTN|nr:TadE/TadG family type IV pilus assembly protein [Actinacidiphila oryziradicis]TKA03017.1 pilus assembly protein [Actinacidiphila oryziradicis]